MSASRKLLQTQAKWGYRRLVRAAEKAFVNDVHAISSAKVTLRDQYACGVESESELKEKVKGVEEVEQMLLHNIVQGQQNEKGVFQVKLTDPDQNKKTHHQITHLTKDAKLPAKPIVTSSKDDDNVCRLGKNDFAI